MSWPPLFPEKSCAAPLVCLRPFQQSGSEFPRRTRAIKVGRNGARVDHRRKAMNEGPRSKTFKVIMPRIARVRLLNGMHGPAQYLIGGCPRGIQIRIT